MRARFAESILARNGIQSVVLGESNIFFNLEIE